MLWRNRLFQFAFATLVIAAAADASAAEFKRVDGKDKKTRIDLNGEIVEGNAEKLKIIVKEANDSLRE